MCYTRHTERRENHLHSIEKVELGGPDAVTLAEVKDHLRITFDADDTYLAMLIKSARLAIEAFCGISLVPKDITAIIDNNEGFELPYGPVVDVAGIDEVIEVIEDEVIITPGVDAVPAIVPVVTNNGEVIESTFIGSTFRKLLTRGSGLTITYRAGYVECPADLKLAILHEIAFQYENRGDVVNQERMSPIAKGYAKMHRRVPKVL